MESEWRTYPLEDCLDALIDYRGKTPKKTSTGIPLVTAKIVKSGYIATPNEFIAEEDYGAWMTRGYPQMGDVVLTTEAPLGEVGQVKFLPVALAQRIVTLRGKCGLLDNGYLLYSMQSHAMQEKLISRSSGTTVIGIKQSELRKIELELPPIEEQRAIAHILGTLDEKIELNRKQSETLEAIALALFKAWFVDFEPIRAKIEGRWQRGESLPGLPAHLYDLFPGRLVDSEQGEIPDGWKHGALSDIASFQNGFAFKSKDWAKSGHPVIKIGNVKPRIIDVAGASFVTPETVNSLERYKLSRGDLLVGMTGYVGETGLVPTIEPAAYLNQRVGRIVTPNKLADLGFTYCLVRSPEFKTYAELKSSGSAQANVSGADLIAYPCVLPTDDLYNTFNEIIFELIFRILENYDSSQAIVQLRDTLLPKLISGELRLSDAEQIGTVV